MKNTILIFVIIFCASVLFAQNSSSSGYSSGNNPHDSLLFDGAPEVFMNKGGDKHCKWKVKHVWGNVKGTKDTDYVVTHICGIPIDTKKEGIKYYHTQKRAWLKDGDEVYDNDSLIMDGESFIQLETNFNDVVNSRIPMNEEKIHDNPFNNQFIIITAKCKNFKVPSCGQRPKENYGNGTPDWDKYPIGDWYFNRTPGAAKYGPKYLFESSGPKYSIHTDQCIIKNNGTKYSLEQIETEDIIKVYEGSVEVQFKKYDTSATMEMLRLQQDYQNGKITLEELTNKAKELQDKIKEESIYNSTKHIVESGFQVTVTGGKIGEVVPIPADDDRWWDKWEE
jgi:hypothetical protein